MCEPSWLEPGNPVQTPEQLAAGASVERWLAAGEKEKVTDQKAKGKGGETASGHGAPCNGGSVLG